MTERFFTKEECEKALAKSEADMIIWMTFLQVMDSGNFVLIDDTLNEPLYRIVPDGHLKIPHPWPGQNPPPWGRQNGVLFSCFSFLTQVF